MEELEFPATTAGGVPAFAAVDEHPAGFGYRHEIQSRPHNSCNGRLLRPGHTVLRGLVRDAPPANPGTAPGPHRLSLLSVGPYGVRPSGIAQGDTRRRSRVHPFDRSPQQITRKTASQTGDRSNG